MYLFQKELTNVGLIENRQYFFLNFFRRISISGFFDFSLHCVLIRMPQGFSLRVIGCLIPNKDCDPANFHDMSLQRVSLSIIYIYIKYQMCYFDRNVDRLKIFEKKHYEKTLDEKPSFTYLRIIKI